jgi:hypothetical protein
VAEKGERLWTANITTFRPRHGATDFIYNGDILLQPTKMKEAYRPQHDIDDITQT